MHLGIDARELAGHPTGVGRYLAGLLAGWAADPAASGCRFTLYTHAPLVATTLPRESRIHRIGGRNSLVWEQVMLPHAAWQDGVDVLFCPAYTAPLLAPMPRVVTVHDISYVTHPEWFPPLHGRRRRWLTRLGSRAARAVITVSDFSRHEILRHLRIPAEHVHVVRSGIDHPLGAGVPRPRELPSEDILYVGSIFNRRHVPTLLEAFALIHARRPRTRLHLVGEDRTYPAEHIAARIAALPDPSAVVWHRYASDTVLAERYAAAGCVAFLSSYEGMGLTPLEGLTAGVPPLLLETPVAQEICGDAALYVAHPDPSEVAAALERLLYDDQVRRRIASATPDVLARYRWTQAASQTLAILQRVAR